MEEQHTVEALQGAKARVTFRVAGDETVNEYQKIVQKHAKSIELKGFRKGKTPVDLLERRFGKEFRAETFHEILEQCTKETLPNLEPKPLGYGQPYLCDSEGIELGGEASGTLIDSFQPGEALEFSVGYETAPEVPLPAPEGLEFEAVEVVVTEEDVAKEIEQLREQNGVMIERKDEAGRDGDILSMQFALQCVSSEEDGKETGKTEMLRTIVRIGQDDAHGFEPKVRAMKSGETSILKGHSFPDTPGVEEPLRGRIEDVQVEISSIRTRELPEPDDDFAQDIDENYETFDDLKKATRNKLEHDAEHVQQSYGLFQIYQHWTRTLEFAVPGSMVAYRTQSAMDAIRKRMDGNEANLMMYLGMSHGGDVQKGLQALEEDTMLGLFVDLVREKLLRNKGWQATDEDIDKELEHSAKHQGMTVADLKKRYEDQWDQVKDHLGREALSSKLSTELVTEAGKDGKAVKLGLVELKERLSGLEQTCRDAVYRKFSPFAEKGGLLGIRSEADTVENIEGQASGDI
ncbi:trigger factor [Candidatus Haliotispira prima]|uniref:Trigger factor n=1 Tax=Candidatus Haliotispira prima TaxID=3034016 RepID=A0ABY8MGP5_9SPIO|nr:trigger factor [Candidatus Haliotispira prima]